jgi:hypothetical protein
MSSSEIPTFRRWAVRTVLAGYGAARDSPSSSSSLPSEITPIPQAHPDAVNASNDSDSSDDGGVDQQFPTGVHWWENENIPPTAGLFPQYTIADLQNDDFVDYITSNGSNLYAVFESIPADVPSGSALDPIDLTVDPPPFPVVPRNFDPLLPGQLPIGLYTIYPFKILMKGTHLTSEIASTMKGEVLSHTHIVFPPSQLESCDAFFISLSQFFPLVCFLTGGEIPSAIEWEQHLWDRGAENRRKTASGEVAGPSGGSSRMPYVDPFPQCFARRVRKSARKM